MKDFPTGWDFFYNRTYEVQPSLSLPFIPCFQIYDELNLRKICGMVIEENRKSLLTYIQQLGKTGLTPKFFFGLMDNMENMA